MQPGGISVGRDVEQEAAEQRMKLVGARARFRGREKGSFAVELRQDSTAILAPHQEVARGGGHHGQDGRIQQEGLDLLRQAVENLRGEIGVEERPLLCRSWPDFWGQLGRKKDGRDPAARFLQHCLCLLPG